MPSLSPTTPVRSMTWQDLRLAARELELPFSLVLDDGTFTVVEVLRHLPGRRLTVAVRDPGRGDGVLKLFYGPRARRDWQRARRGQDAFRRVGVLTTAVVAEQAGKAPWLLYARLAGAEHATARDGVTLAGILGRLHHAGYSHGDLHVGNFLRDPAGVIHSIDPDAITPRLRTVEAGLQELAILLAQFPVSEPVDVPGSLDAYLTARGEAGSVARTARLLRLLRQARQRRVTHYLRKATRDCTNFAVGATPVGRWFARREVASVVAQFAANPEQWFEADGAALKRGNSATVVRLAIGGVELVAKRYNITGPWQRLRRVFRRRARDAWYNGLQLAFLGIPTALPLGLLETGSRWRPGPAYVLMERLGGRDLAALTAAGVIDRFTIQEVVDIVSWMRSAGLAHGDFKSTNFVLHEGRLHLIDVDSVHTGDMHEDVHRLLANWPADSAVSQALREALLAEGIAAGPT